MEKGESKHMYKDDSHGRDLEAMESNVSLILQEKDRCYNQKNWYLVTKKH